MPSKALRQRLEERSDDELLAILREHDSAQWVPAVFPMAEDILRGRGIDIAAALSQAPESQAAPAEEPMIPIARFATVVESEACRSALAGAGFSVVGADEFLLQVDPAMGPALGGFRLAVPISEAEDARAFLAAAEAGELSAGLVECSACGSTEVLSERKVSRSGTFLNTLLLGPIVQDAIISFKCMSCGAIWQ